MGHRPNTESPTTLAIVGTAEGVSKTDGKRISCNACNAPFHEKCFYSSVVKPEDGVGPCCLEAQ